MTPGAATNEVVFADERAEIERLRREDATILINGDEDPSAYTGEEYRQELRKGLEKYGDQIKQLPWGSGSGFRGGDKAGQFFCAYVGERLFLRFVPADRGAIVRDTLSCLRLNLQRKRPTVTHEWRCDGYLLCLAHGAPRHLQ